MSNYTPTTEVVKRGYVVAEVNGLKVRDRFEDADVTLIPEEFDRWLASVERAAAVKAIENLADHVGAEFFKDAGQVASLPDVRQWLRSCAEAYRRKDNDDD